MYNLENLSAKHPPKREGVSPKTTGCEAPTRNKAQSASEEASRALPSRKLRLLAGWPAADAAPASPDETREAAGV